MKESGAWNLNNGYNIYYRDIAKKLQLNNIFSEVKYCVVIIRNLNSLVYNNEKNCDLFKSAMLWFLQSVFPHLSLYQLKINSHCTLMYVLKYAKYFEGQNMRIRSQTCVVSFLRISFYVPKYVVGFFTFSGQNIRYLTISLSGEVIDLTFYIF